MPRGSRWVRVSATNRGRPRWAKAYQRRAGGRGGAVVVAVGAQAVGAALAVVVPGDVGPRVVAVLPAPVVDDLVVVDEGVHGHAGQGLAQQALRQHGLVGLVEAADGRAWVEQARGGVGVDLVAREDGELERRVIRLGAPLAQALPDVVGWASLPAGAWGGAFGQAAGVEAAAQGEHPGLTSGGGGFGLGRGRGQGASEADGGQGTQQGSSIRSWPAVSL